MIFMYNITTFSVQIVTKGDKKVKKGGTFADTSAATRFLTLFRGFLGSCDRGLRKRHHVLVKKGVLRANPNETTPPTQILQVDLPPFLHTFLTDLVVFMI